MAYVAAVTADGGIPLLTRCSVGLPQLSFTAMGALFGISTYSRVHCIAALSSKSCQLLYRRTEGLRIFNVSYYSEGISEEYDLWCCAECGVCVRVCELVCVYQYRFLNIAAAYIVYIYSKLR